jgi:hypothetical protein
MIILLILIILIVYGFTKLKGEKLCINDILSGLWFPIFLVILVLFFIYVN